MNNVNEARKAFDQKLEKWAKANGYRLRGYLWRSEKDYLTSRIEADCFVADRTAYGNGAILERVVLD